MKGFKTEGKKRLPDTANKNGAGWCWLVLGRCLDL